MKPTLRFFSLSPLRVFFASLLLLLGTAPLPQSRASAQRTTRVVAPAEVDATQRARELFEQGLAALQQESWEQARGLFEEAWALTPRPSILVNLATAQRQTGRLIEARDSYRLFLVRFADHELAAQARQALEEVESLMPSLIIHVEHGRPGDVVFLDEVPIATLDRAFEANPGLREVSLRRGEVTLQSVRVRVELEGHEEVFLRGVDLSPTAAVGEGAGAGMTDPLPRSDDTPVIVGVTLAAVLVVAGGVVLGVLLGTQEQTSMRSPTEPSILGGFVVFE